MNSLPQVLPSINRQVRLLDGRIVRVTFNKPFSIKSDSASHRWDLSWLKPDSIWGELLLEILTKLLCTHSLTYANQCAYVAKALFNNQIFKPYGSIRLKEIAKLPEFVPLSYWRALQPLLKRMANQDTKGALDDDLKMFLKQPRKWETRGKGEYFALVTNDPEHGAFTEQELICIQTEIHKAYQNNIITLEEYALVWFLMATGVRPIQVARMKVDDVKIYDGPEGKEITLYLPLAKGHGTDQGKWRRRCPTVLAEILIKYIGQLNRSSSDCLFKDNSDKISHSISRVFLKVKTYSERTQARINIFPYRFRYTLGTRAIATGGTDAEVARLLTHRTTACVAYYRAAMPHLQKPIKDALSGEMGLIASAFKGILIKNSEEATRKGQVDALIRDFLNLNGETLGACGTVAKCHQHAPQACLTCNKFEPFVDAPWDKLLSVLQADMDSENEDRIKLIGLQFIEAVNEIKRKCAEYKKEIDT